MKAYEEHIKFLTSSPSLEAIVNFRPTEAVLQRVRYLSMIDRIGAITEEERAELREFHKAQQFLEGLKIRARRRLEAVAT